MDLFNYLYKRLLSCVLVFILSFTVALAADDDDDDTPKGPKFLELEYNEEITHKETEDNFMKNLQRDCKDFGLKKLDKQNEISTKKILETYPKEIAFRYFKKNMDKLCYYGFSIALRYIQKEYQSKIETLALNKINSCLGKKKSTAFCNSIQHEYFYIDTAQLLGQFCTSSSLTLFKKINCAYKDLKKKGCDFYNTRNYKKCPEYQNHTVEVQNLHKHFFNQNCKKLKWRVPSCLKM